MAERLVEIPRRLLLPALEWCLPSALVWWLVQLLVSHFLQAVLGLHLCK
jgi:hypothetical protein